MKPGEYAHSLRAIGVWLDSQRALQVTVGNSDDRVVVAWYERGGLVKHQRYQTEELTELASQAQQQRGVGPVANRERRGDMLRTLGQDLDRDDVAMLGIIETEAGFRVLARDGVQTQEHFFRTSELAAQDRERRAMRRVA